MKSTPPPYQSRKDHSAPVMNTDAAMTIATQIQSLLGEGIVVYHPDEGIFEVQDIPDLEAAAAELTKTLRGRFEVCLAESVLQVKPQSSPSSE